MALWILLKVTQSATVLILLFATSFSTPVVPNWLNDPCHYSNKSEHIRHGRDTKLEAWKKQLKTTAMEFQSLSATIDRLYSKTDGLKDMKLKNTIQSKVKKNHMRNYNTLQQFVIAMDTLASQKNLPTADDFDMEKRQEIFSVVMHMSKRLLCEVKESLPAKNASKFNDKQLARIVRNVHNMITHPSDYTTVHVQDKIYLRNFKNFIRNWWIKSNKKGGKSTMKNGKRKKKVAPKL